MPKAKKRNSSSSSSSSSNRSNSSSSYSKSSNNSIDKDKVDKKYSDHSCSKKKNKEYIKDQTSKRQERDRSRTRRHNNYHYKKHSEKNPSSNSEEIKKLPRLIKGRGMVRRDESHALLGWDEEDYFKVNKKLVDSGQKFKANFYRNHNRFREDRSNSKKEGGWKHDKFNDTAPDAKLRDSPKYDSH